MPLFLKNSMHRIRAFTRSIRFRLTAWSVAILAVILLIFSVFIYVRTVNDLQGDIHNQLQMKTQQLNLMYRSSGMFDPDHDFHPPLQPNPGSLRESDQLALIGVDGSILQTGGGMEAVTISQLLKAWQSIAQSEPRPAYVSAPKSAYLKMDYLYLISPLMADQHFGGLLILGQPVDPSGQLPRLAVTLFLGSLATLALALAGGYWLAGRAMAPVRSITRTARSIGETDLHRRLHLDTEDELGELADTFNAMLERLEAAFKRQRQFTADASHELRTPLTIVSLEADQALEHPRSAVEYQRSLQVIKSENEFMSRLVNDLLDLARMDAGQTQLTMEPVDLSDIALDAVERLDTLARRDGVELSVGDLPEAHVLGDRRLLSMMLTNLVQNAIKYAGGQGHHVRVETGQVRMDGKIFAWAQVNDDGPGIPDEALPHLFDRFYRVDQARTRSEVDLPVSGAGPNRGRTAHGIPEGDPSAVPDGSGLGLAIVQWISQAHGGQVSVESQAGKGASFKVCLPWNDEKRSSTLPS